MRGASPSWVATPGTLVSAAPVRPSESTTLLAIRSSWTVPVMMKEPAGKSTSSAVNDVGILSGQGLQYQWREKLTEARLPSLQHANLAKIAERCRRQFRELQIISQTVQPRAVPRCRVLASELTVDVNR